MVKQTKQLFECDYFVGWHLKGLEKSCSTENGMIVRKIYINHKCSQFMHAKFFFIWYALQLMFFFILMIHIKIFNKFNLYTQMF